MHGFWKLIPTLLIIGAIGVALCVRPPSKPVPEGELKRLVISIAALYLVGTVAIFSHRIVLGGIVFGAGLLVCAVALWLSRGDAPPPPRDDDGGTRPPSPPPEPQDPFDWAFYEDQVRDPVPY